MFRKIIQAIAVFFRRFFTERCDELAASLTYSTLLAIVPMLIVCVYILSFFPSFSGAVEGIEHFLLDNFVASTAAQISQQLQTFVDQMAHLSRLKIFFLAVVCVLMIYHIVRSYNRIWHTRGKHHLALEFLVYIVILILSPILFALTFFLGPLLSEQMGSSWDWFSHSFLSTFMKYVFPFFITFFVFSLFNYILPYCRVKLRWALLSGFCTMVLFELSKWGFTYYFSHFDTYQIIYGTLAIIPLFLIWIYLSWMIVLGGVLMCHMLTVGLHASKDILDHTSREISHGDE